MLGEVFVWAGGELAISEKILIFEPNYSIMYTGMLHTHTTFVFIYILLFIYKVYLLLADKHEALAKFRKKSKVIAEMIVPVIFLGTGIYLAMNSGDLGTWFYIKMGLLVISIPLGIVAFRKNSKMLAILTLLLFVAMIFITYDRNKMGAGASNAPATPTTMVDGKALYEANCSKCHGSDGTMGLSGAANLQTSNMADDEIKSTIANGKKMMPPNPGNLTPEQISAVADYVKTLRK